MRVLFASLLFLLSLRSTEPFKSLRNAAESHTSNISALLRKATETTDNAAAGASRELLFWNPFAGKPDEENDGENGGSPHHHVQGHKKNRISEKHDATKAIEEAMEQVEKAIVNLDDPSGDAALSSDSEEEGHQSSHHTKEELEKEAAEAEEKIEKLHNSPHHVKGHKKNHISEKHDATKAIEEALEQMEKALLNFKDPEMKEELEKEIEEAEEEIEKLQKATETTDSADAAVSGESEEGHPSPHHVKGHKKNHISEKHDATKAIEEALENMEKAILNVNDPKMKEELGKEVREAEDEIEKLSASSESEEGHHSPHHIKGHKKNHISDKHDATKAIEEAVEKMEKAILNLEDPEVKGELEKEVREAEEEIAALEKEVREAEAELERLQNSPVHFHIKGHKKNRISEAHDATKAIEEALEKMEKAILNLEDPEVKEELETDVREAEKEIEELEKKIRETEEEIEKAEKLHPHHIKGHKKNHISEKHDATKAIEEALAKMEKAILSIQEEDRHIKGHKKNRISKKHDATKAIEEALKKMEKAILTLKDPEMRDELEKEVREDEEEIEKLLNGTVTLTVWTTPNRDWHNYLFESVKDIVLYLSDQLVFEPNMYIHNGGQVCRADGVMDERRRKICEHNCLYEGRYCYLPGVDDDPNYSHLVGFLMVVESARRLCVWQIASKRNDPKLFWDYLETMQKTHCDEKLTPDCLDDVFSQIFVDGNEVDTCLFNGKRPDENVENELLERQLDLAWKTPVTDVPQVFINGKPLELAPLDLNTESIFQAVCEAYHEESAPSLCGFFNNSTDTADQDQGEDQGFDDDGLVVNDELTESINGTWSDPDFGRDPDTTESLNDFVGHDLDSLLQHELPGNPFGEDENGEPLPAPPELNRPGFAKLAHMLAKKDIFVYQMLQNCGVDFRRPGPLVHALEAGDQSAFFSHAPLCRRSSKRQFTKATDGFEQCAGFDILEYADHNAAALGHSFFGCLNAFATVPDDHVILEECTALVLNTGIWRGIGHFLEYNEMICPCIPQLLWDLPDCVFQRPQSTTFLDGPAVKLSTCLVAEMCTRIEPMCHAEVKILNECLPTHGEFSCGEIEQVCKEKRSIFFTAPYPLAGASFPQRCQDHATQGENTYVIERYNYYRENCVMKDDTIREFGPPNEEEEDFMKRIVHLEDEHKMAWHTTLLVGMVLYLATWYAVALIYAYKRAPQEDRNSPFAIQTRIGQDSYQDEVDLRDEVDRMRIMGTYSDSPQEAYRDEVAFENNDDEDDDGDFTDAKSRFSDYTDAKSQFFDTPQEPYRDEVDDIDDVIEVWNAN